MMGSWQTSDGKTHEMADVWFAKDAAGATAPKLDELLAAAHTDLVAGLPLPASVPDEGGAKPVAPMAHPATDPGGPASHHSSLDDELLRQQTQLL